METERTQGFVWHMYHDHLITYCWNYERRVRDIRAFKQKHEIAERLKRFQFVIGELPKSFQHRQDNSTITQLTHAHKDAVMKLHAEECPNCSWNGRRLRFPNHWLRRAWCIVWKWCKDKYYPHNCNWPNWSHKWPWNDC